MEREERIRKRAYEIYLERMVEGADGNELTDWLDAEFEIDRHKHTYQFYKPEDEQ